MSILNIELPADLIARLEAAAGAVPEEKARLVREALERLLDERVASRARREARLLALQPFPDGKSAYDMMQDVCGKFEGPGDLSTNPKYMEGFGEE